MYQVHCTLYYAGNIQWQLSKENFRSFRMRFSFTKLPVFTASGKKSKEKKQSKYPLYWNCIVTRCRFHADEHLLWAESIMSNLSLSCFLKEMYLFSSIPSAWSWGASWEHCSHTAQWPQPLEWQNWGISAGFPHRVAFVPAPGASLLARENEIQIR